MDDLDADIAEFRDEPKARLGLIDSLYLALPDPRAFDALLAAATDPAVSDTVRCAAWKVWHNDEPERAEERERFVAAAIATTAAPGTSDLVRDYAIVALTYHADRPDVEAALLPIMLDRAEGYSVRSAAFQVLSRRGHERRTTAFRQLFADPRLGEEVETYFRHANRNSG